MSGLGFRITADDRQFLNTLRRSGYAIDNFSRKAVDEGARIEDVFKRIAAAAGITFSAIQLKSFVSSLVKVRGEFQQLAIAFEVMLGSKEKADKLMAQMVDTAARTPFDLSGVANGAKQLLAYGTAAEEVNDTLIRLGNIASGLSIPLNDIVYLYGTTQTQGRLFTQDVRQFMGRGIPLVKELAKELGKTEEQINSMVTAGQIGFDKVRTVIEKMTNEGGMFYQLMEKQSTSWTGQIANLEDAWDMMLNEMGTKSESVFTTSIELATTLVENYEKVGKVIMGMIATYGAYKTAVAVATVATKGWTIAQMAQYNVLLLLEKAQKLLNATMLSNPYVLATVAIVSLVAAVWALSDATSTQELAQERLNKILEDAAQKKENLENKSNQLISVINSETKTIYDQIIAYKKLQEIYPEWLKNISLVEFKTLSLQEQQKQLAKAINNIESKDATDQLNAFTSFENKLNNIQGKGWKGTGEYNQLIRDLGKLLDMEGASAHLIRETFTKTLELLKKHNKEREEAIKQSEFEALSEDEKKKILQDQLEELKKQESAIDSKIKATGIFNSELNKGDTVLKNWFNNEHKIKNMFALANPVLKGWISSLNTVKAQIEDINNKLNPAAQVVTKNKAYWEKQKKDAENVLNEMDGSQLTSKDGKAQRKLRDEADKMLKKWDFSDKVTKTVENIAQKKLEAEQDLIRRQKDLNHEQVNMALDLEHRLAEIKESSFKKETELAQIEYQEQIQSAKEHIDNLIREQQEIEKLEFIKKNGTDKGFKPKTNAFEDLSEELKAHIISLDIIAGKELEAKIKEINKNIAAAVAEQDVAFASIYEQEVDSINVHYMELLRQADGQEELINKIIRNWNKALDIASKGRDIRTVDNAEELALQENQNLESLGMTELVEQKRLEIIRKYGQERLELLKALAAQGDEQAAQEAKVLEKKLDGLKAVPKGLKGFADEALFKGIVKGFISMGDSAEDAEKKTINLLSNIKQGASQVVAVIDDLKSMFNGLSEDLDIALNSLGNIASGFATGGLVGGTMSLISEGINIFNKSAQVNKEHEDALRKLLLAKIELQRTYNKLLLEEQLLFKEGNTIFGTDQIGRAKNAIDVYRKSIEGFKQEAAGGWEPNELYEKALTAMASKKGLFGVFAKKQLNDYKAKLDAYNKGFAALANVDIVTGSRKSGWGPWKKRKDVYSSLLSVYPQIIDAEGNLDVALAQTIINTHNMSDANRALIQSLIDLQEQAEAAEEELRNYLSETYGVLGDSLADSIVEAFATGEDAALKFQDSVTDILNNLAKQMVYSLFLSDMFSNLQKQIEGVYKDMAMGVIDEKELSRRVTNLLGSFFNGLEGSIGQANEFLETFWQNAEANGIKRPEGSGSSAGDSKGIQSISQDSAVELIGQFYAANQKIADIRNINEFSRTQLISVSNSNRQLVELTKEGHDIFREQLEYQRQTAQNTAETAKILKEIDKRGLSIRN